MKKVWRNQPPLPPAGKLVLNENELKWPRVKVSD